MSHQEPVGGCLGNLGSLRVRTASRTGLKPVLHAPEPALLTTVFREMAQAVSHPP
jgi:hypothetical protein